MGDDLQQYFLGGILGVGKASQHPEGKVEYQVLYA